MYCLYSCSIECGQKPLLCREYSSFSMNCNTSCVIWCVPHRKHPRTLPIRNRRKTLDFPDLYGTWKQLKWKTANKRIFTFAFISTDNFYSFPPSTAIHEANVARQQWKASKMRVHSTWWVYFYVLSRVWIAGRWYVCLTHCASVRGSSCSSSNGSAYAYLSLCSILYIYIYNSRRKA